MSESAETFNAVKELEELGYKFVDYIFAFGAWVSLVHKDCECTLEAFLKTATEEEQVKLALYSATIRVSEKHLSDLQGRMMELDK